MFLLFLNLLAHFISSGVWKPHPYFWLSRIFWSLTLLNISNRLPQMKYEFWNVLVVSFTHSKWTPSIEFFRRINSVHINTSFLCPIVLFRWDTKRPHDSYNHLYEFSNLWLRSIFPWRMGFYVGLFNTVLLAVICSFFPKFTLCIFCL